MKILMLGNSFTAANHIPEKLAELTGAQVSSHTRGGGRLTEHLNPKTAMGAQTLEALAGGQWDYVVLQEMSNAPIKTKQKFQKIVAELCTKIRENGAEPVLYATWAYKKDGDRMKEMPYSYEEMAKGLYDSYHEAAEANHTLIADVGKAFYERADKENLYADDGRHPNEAGSQLAAQVIADVILKDSSRKKPEPDAGQFVKNVDTVNRKDDRLRVLYLYQILMQYSDAEHPLTTKDIQRLMLEEHQIHLHRTTVPDYVGLLREAGIQVFGERRRTFVYYLESRSFSQTELKLLIDAVQASRFITEDKTKILTEKLAAQASEQSREQLVRSLHTTGKIKAENEDVYNIVDVVNEAINRKVKISFYYFDYNLHKNRVLKNEGEPYTLSPYNLIWDGDFYYVIGYCDDRESVRVFRVDRILSMPEILEEEGVRRPKGYHVEHYTQEAFRMYSTQDVVKVKLLCDSSAMKAVIDQFGLHCRTKMLDEEHFQATVKVCIGPTFYRWVFGYGGKIRITSPEEVKDGYRQALEEALNNL